MESLPMAPPEAPLPPFVLRHALAIDGDAATGTILAARCSFCGEAHAPCAVNLAAAREGDPRLAPERVWARLVALNVEKNNTLLRSLREGRVL